MGELDTEANVPTAMVPINVAKPSFSHLGISDQTGVNKPLNGTGAVRGYRFQGIMDSQIIPPLHRGQVAKPLVRKLMRYYLRHALLRGSR